jgi:PAS domain S-box-containing protein
MTTDMRKTGIDVVGDIQWGTHFCLFYETKADLLDTLVRYCKSGLESNELCLWVVAEPVTTDEARDALRDAMSRPDVDRCLAAGSLELVAAHDWYLQGGSFDLQRVTSGWHRTLQRALSKGYAGVRVTGDTAWLQKKDWKDFLEYEDGLNESIANQHLAVLCTYPLAACSAAEILDVVRTHQFAIAKRHGAWDVIETAGLKQAKAEIKRLNEQLEQRVAERTHELTAVIDRLGREVFERKRAEDALRRSEAYLAEAQRLTHTGSWALDVRTKETLHASEEHSRLFGSPPGDLPSFDTFRERIHADDRARVSDTLERAIRERADYESVHRAALPDGSIRYLHTVGHPIVNASGDLIEFVGTTMDVTERRRTEQALEELAGRLIFAQEEERSRIGRELHDHVSQRLGLLAIRLDQLRAHADVTSPVAAAIDAIREGTREIERDVHGLSRRLHSSTLDYLGLVPALQRLVEDFSARHGIPVALAHESMPSPLPSSVALCLFRVAEESLANVAKHSQARSVRVRVHGAADGIRLSIDDDGIGFAIAHATIRSGLGFVSMQERLRMLRGTVRIESAPARGTTIDAWIPAASLVMTPQVQAAVMPSASAFHPASPESETKRRQSAR